MKQLMASHRLAKVANYRQNKTFPEIWRYMKQLMASHRLANVENYRQSKQFPEIWR